MAGDATNGQTWGCYTLWDRWATHFTGGALAYPPVTWIRVWSTLSVSGEALECRSREKVRGGGQEKSGDFRWIRIFVAADCKKEMEKRMLARMESCFFVFSTLPPAMCLVGE